MASYMELRDRFFAGGLRSKVAVAVCIKAHAILQEAAPSADRLDWAAGAFASAESESLRMLRYLLAANKDATTAVIDGAADSVIQAKVDEVVDKIYP